MKNLFKITAFLISFASVSQQTVIHGIVKDARTNSPVSYASVAIKDSPAGTITNEEGAFQLSISKPETISVSSVGYISINIPVSPSDKENKIISLEQEDIQLEEVAISKTPLNEVLHQLILSSVAKFDKQIVMHTYYREFVKDNDRITKFSDGLLSYYIDRTGKKAKSNLVVNQNRSVQLFSGDDEEIFKDSGSNFDVQDGIMVGNFGPLYRLVVNKQENYIFHLKSKPGANSNLMIITFEPKDDVKKLLFEGSITYDPENRLIYEVEMGYAPSHAQYAFSMSLFGLKYLILDESYKAGYKLVNANYILSYSKRYEKFKFWTKNEKVDETLEYKSDLVVTDFSTENVAYDKNQLYKKKQLYKKPTDYTDKFWQQNNAIVLTGQEKAMIQSLEETMPLGSQIKKTE